MWPLYVLVLFVLFKIYNKLSAGKCTSKTIMTGKVVIVTGANGGIGFETSKDLASRGAKVILACRNERLGKEAEKRIRDETNNNHVIFMKLDLNSLDSVRGFVDEFKSKEVKLDVLINNAGVGAVGNTLSRDGLINEMQVNHYGHFLLTVLLVPWLKRSEAGRVIHVSSGLHRFGRFDFEKINKEKAYGDFQTYCNTKLCNILFSNELARKLKGTKVVSNSLHPGHVRTGIYRNRGGAVELLMNFITGVFLKNVVEGAQTSIHLAVSEECEQVSGKYFVDCREASPSALAQDKDLAARFWLYSEKMVKLKLTETI